MVSSIKRRSRGRGISKSRGWREYQRILLMRPNELKLMIDFVWYEKKKDAIKIRSL